MQTFFIIIITLCTSVMMFLELKKIIISGRKKYALLESARDLLEKCLAMGPNSIVA